MTRLGIVGTFSVVLLAIAVGETYRLYHTPAVTIERLEPCCVFTERIARARVHGSGFRPYLRAHIEGASSPTWRISEAPGGDAVVMRPGMPVASPGATAYSPVFLVETPTQADLQLPALPKGTYTLVLYNETRVVARLPGAIKVQVPPDTLDMDGEFVDVTEAQASALGRQALLRTGDTYPWGELLSVGKPRRNGEADWRVPARLRLACVAERGSCVTGETPLVPGASVAIGLPDGWNVLTFNALTPVTPLTPIEVSVDCNLSPDVAAWLKRMPDTPQPNARMRIVGRRFGEQTYGTAVFGPDVWSAGPVIPTTIRVRLLASKSNDEWTFGNAPLRVGTSLSVDTPTFTAQGVVVQVHANAVP